MASAEAATATKIKRPSLWTAVLIHDSNTPMEFEYKVLNEIFDLTPDETMSALRTAHSEGRAAVYTNTLEIVQQKIDDAKQISQACNIPLRFIKEEA